MMAIETDATTDLEALLEKIPELRQLDANLRSWLWSFPKENREIEIGREIQWLEREVKPEQSRNPERR